MSKSTDRQDRAARLAAVRAAQQRRERRRTVVIIGATVGVCVVLVALVAVAITGERSRRAEVEAAADAPIEGVEQFGELAQDHVDGPVSYEQTPPVGGPHAGVWTNCGVYTQGVSDEQSVHSLEHGAVWVTYQPDLPADQVEQLTRLADLSTYTLVSPYEGLPSPVVASAWGVQLALAEATDPRLEPFLVKYSQGEQTPEPGAPCTGGTGTPS